ncbi:MAG: rhodanese-like domain-containing protein [Candidatus Sedimenticola endophacoides]
MGIFPERRFTVVDGGWLKPRLDDPDLILIDMSFDPTQYQRFHIPGAVHIPHKYLTSTRRDGVSVRAGDRQLKQILGYLGITPESQIVIYDDMGGLEAGRLFWELERIGHENLALLDGGLVKWILDGKRVVARESEPRSKAYPGARNALSTSRGPGGGPGRSRCASTRGSC